MDNKKILVGVIAVLAVALIFETAYLFGRGARQDNKNIITPYYPAPQLVDPPVNHINHINMFDYWIGWDPFVEMARMQQAIQRMFEGSFVDGLFDHTIYRTSAAFEPNISINQKDNAYIIKADLPGMDKNAINIEINGRLLTISGERKGEKTKQDKGFYRQELSYGAFSRSVMLPEDSKTNQITSEYKNGVLTITIPKESITKPANSAVKIPVQ